MIVMTTVRIAIEVAMILMMVMVVRMTLMITMVQWQPGNGRADWELKPAVANLTKSSHFCLSIQFCKQPAVEWPPKQATHVANATTSPWPVWPWMVVTIDVYDDCDEGGDDFDDGHGVCDGYDDHD